MWHGSLAYAVALISLTIAPMSRAHAGQVSLTLVGPALDLSTDVSPTRNRPDVAFNSRANEFLVVWDDRRILENFADIYGQRIAGDGTLIGDNIPVVLKEEPQIDAAIVYNAVSDRYLVTWRTQESGFFNRTRGRMLGPDGAPVSEDTYITQAANEGSIATSTVNVVMVHVARGNGVHAQLVSPDGTPVGGPQTVAAGGSDAPNGQVVYNTVSHEYFATWRDQVAWNLQGRRIGPNGIPLGNPFVISSTFPTSARAASQAHRAIDNRYLVVFGNFSGPGILGQFVAADGSLIGGNFTIIADAPQNTAPSIAHDPAGDMFVIIWRSGDDLLAQALDATGLPIADRVILAAETVEGRDPRVIHNAVTGEFLAVWEDVRHARLGQKDVFAQRMTITVEPSADLDGDGDVDGHDLAIMLGGWGACPFFCLCCCPGDLNCDGNINGLDLAMLLGAWAP